MASSLDVDGHYRCGKVPADRILVSHQSACSIGTSYNCEYDQHVEGFDGPGADNRPSRYGLPIVHDRGLLSRNLDVGLRKLVNWGHLRSLKVSLGSQIVSPEAEISS